MPPDSVAKNVTTTNTQEQPDPESYPDSAIAETGDEPDIASIERIYRYTSLPSVHPPKTPLTRQKTRLPHNPPLLDPLLPLLSNPLQRRPRANHERRLRPRPGHRAQSHTAPDLDRSGAVLRVLCGV